MVTLPDGRVQTFVEFKEIIRTNFANPSDEDILFAWKKQEAELRKEDPNNILPPLKAMGLSQ